MKFDFTELTVPNSSSRPTLAELLASPLTVRRETVPTSAPDSQRSGLIDDEIGFELNEILFFSHCNFV